MNLDFESRKLITRRFFFRDCSIGIGSLALASLLKGTNVFGATRPTPTNPFAPRAPHFTPRAKRVIYMFQAGAPSQLDLFDYKPTLAKYDGKTVPAELVRRRLHTIPARMADYFRMGALGGVLSGTLGAQGHYANGLAALYLATGQDVACVAESAVGVTRMELTTTGDLYASVTLPSIIVGTVGGGTNLPGQRACLELMGLAGPGHAAALAEVCAGLCLAGELSLIGALCAGQFASAHRKLARDVRDQNHQEGGGNA